MLLTSIDIQKNVLRYNAFNILIFAHEMEHISSKRD